MITLPDKDPEEVLDYQVSFADLIPADFVLDTAAAVVESASPSESPLSLDVLTADVTQNANNSPLRDDSVTVWLSGGTVGCKYTVKVTVSDSQGVPHDRQYVRRLRVKVKPQ